VVGGEGVQALLSSPSAQTHQEAHDRTNQEYHEKDFCDAGSADRNAAESEKRRNQGDDEKHNSIMKHERTF
jgi:hypothetical protein